MYITIWERSILGSIIFSLYWTGFLPYSQIQIFFIYFYIHIYVFRWTRYTPIYEILRYRDFGILRNCWNSVCDRKIHVFSSVTKFSVSIYWISTHCTAWLSTQQRLFTLFSAACHTAPAWYLHMPEIVTHSRNLLATRSVADTHYAFLRLFFFCT